MLSIREKEIGRLTILGFTHKQISGKLIISPKTVENYKANVIKKPNFKSKPDLIQYSITNNIIKMELIRGDMGCPTFDYCCECS
ncbi:LuxR C-terminal-related transcriptional regulator [Bacillus safensis]|uniref:LuxR C-terminal-related transcriptional regulator n=1 Tax=Bacillus safensis TaxID=561879 RepID=UPI003982AC73